MRAKCLLLALLRGMKVEDVISRLGGISCGGKGTLGEKDNVVVNAPHTAVELAGEWSHPYSRMEAAFPLEWVKCSKFFPYVTKIDNGFGDRNLVCCNVD